MNFTIENSTTPIHVNAVWMGCDLSLSIYGGDAPHIGCTVLAVPRPSLTGQGNSATVSTLNCVGHKDDFVATAVAKELAATLQVTVACSCGIHVDNASPQTIKDITDCIPQIIQTVLSTRED